MVKQVEEVLGKLNSHHGRARGSVMDPAVYCPKSVLVEPGALHTDVVTINSAYMASMKHQMVKKVCKVCGFPACPCTKCICIALRDGKGPDSSTRHSCWLSSRTVGRKSKNHMAETEDQYQQRLAAWKAYGVDSCPVFKSGGFAFD